MDKNNLYYKKYIKYKNKYLTMKNILIGGMLHKNLTFKNKQDVLTLNKISVDKQYYHEFQSVDRICQLRAVNNFLENNVYNKANIINYLLEIYNNFKSIHNIAINIKNIFTEKFATYFKSQHSYDRLYANIVKFIKYIEVLYESYLILEEKNLLPEEKIKKMFSHDKNIINGIYYISSGNENNVINMEELMFMLSFRYIHDKIYFQPIGSIYNYNGLKPIKVVDIPKILDMNFINKFVIDDMIFNYASVFHLHKNDTITHIDSNINKFENYDITIDKIQPTDKPIDELLFAYAYVFYINDPIDKIEIKCVNEPYLNIIYINYFEKLKKFVVEVKSTNMCNII